MGIFRLLILAFAVWLGYKILRYLFVKSARKPSPRQRRSSEQKTVDKMVCCQVCEVHVPLADAKLIDGQYYCSKHSA